MDNLLMTQVTISDPLSGVTSFNFTPREAMNTIIMKLFAEHGELDLVGFTKNITQEILPEHVQSPNTIQEGGTVCIPKNTLRQMYQEWLQFTKLRDECIVTMQEQLKQLKPANTSLFVDFCENNLDITKQVFECETCGYEARNMKALSAHRKGKKCMDLRVLSDETTSHKDPNEENVSQITPQNE